jgi:hypothetical protein
LQALWHQRAEKAARFANRMLISVRQRFADALIRKKLVPKHENTAL